MKLDNFVFMGMVEIDVYDMVSSGRLFYFSILNYISSKSVSELVFIKEWLSTYLLLGYIISY